MDLISVIVPVYKVEKYLDKCVQSIVNQTYKNLEIILVDDGSPDNCGAICDVWAEKDSRIKVIHQRNQGGGAARNAGLDIASGEWIGFVDSDDYIAPEMYEHLKSILDTGADIAECCFLETTNDNVALDSGKGIWEYYTVSDAMRRHLDDKIFRQLIWNKLYRRESVGDIRFPVGKKIDDEFFTYRVIANCRKLAHSDRRMYAYRQQADSVMHQSFSLERLQAVDAKCQRLDLLKERFPTLIPDAKINLWYTCLYQGQMAMRHLDKDAQHEALAILSKAMANYPLTQDEMNALAFQQKIWANLSKLSFTMTCKIRNFLRIGN